MADVFPPHRCGLWRLPYKEVKQLLPFQPTLQVVVLVHRPHAFRGSSENHIALLERDELGDILDQIGNVEDHVGRMSALAGFAIDFELEADIAPVGELGGILEIGDGRGMVESFGQRPREAFFLGFALQVAGGEVNAKADAIHIGMGEFPLHIFPFARNPEHQLAFKVDILREFGVIEILILLEQGSIGLEEDNGLLGDRIAQFLGVIGVVPPDSDNFHGVKN